MTPYKPNGKDWEEDQEEQIEERSPWWKFWKKDKKGLLEANSPVIGTPLEEKLNGDNLNEEEQKEVEKALQETKQAEKTQKRRKILRKGIKGTLATIALIGAYLGGSALYKNFGNPSSNEILSHFFKPGIYALEGVNPLSSTADEEYLEAKGLTKVDPLSKFDPFDVEWVGKYMPNHQIADLLENYDIKDLKEAVNSEIKLIDIYFINKLGKTILPTEYLKEITNLEELGFEDIEIAKLSRKYSIDELKKLNKELDEKGYKEKADFMIKGYSFDLIKKIKENSQYKLPKEFIEDIIKHYDSKTINSIINDKELNIDLLIDLIRVKQEQAQNCANDYEFTNILKQYKKRLTVRELADLTDIKKENKQTFEKISDYLEDNSFNKFRLYKITDLVKKNVLHESYPEYEKIIKLFEDDNKALIKEAEKETYEPLRRPKLASIKEWDEALIEIAEKIDFNFLKNNYQRILNTLSKYKNINYALTSNSMFEKTGLKIIANHLDNENIDSRLKLLEDLFLVSDLINKNPIKIMPKIFEYEEHPDLIETILKNCGENDGERCGLVFSKLPIKPEKLTKKIKEKLKEFAIEYKEYVSWVYDLMGYLDVGVEFIDKKKDFIDVIRKNIKLETSYAFNSYGWSWLHDIPKKAYKEDIDLLTVLAENAKDNIATAAKRIYEYPGLHRKQLILQKEKTKALAKKFKKGVWAVYEQISDHGFDFYEKHEDLFDFIKKHAGEDFEGYARIRSYLFTKHPDLLKTIAKNEKKETGNACYALNQFRRLFPSRIDNSTLDEVHYNLLKTIAENAKDKTKEAYDGLLYFVSGKDAYSISLQQYYPTCPLFDENVCALLEAVTRKTKEKTKEAYFALKRCDLDFVKKNVIEFIMVANKYDNVIETFEKIEKQPFLLKELAYK